MDQHPLGVFFVAGVFVKHIFEGQYQEFVFDCGEVVVTYPVSWGFIVPPVLGRELHVQDGVPMLYTVSSSES
jgi:hypothetical protein